MEKRETPIVKNNCENGNNTKNSSQNGYHKTKQTLVVYVKPHPPTFHNGRYINYNDYYVIEVGSKKKVIFTEEYMNKWIKTEVDSEAIVWK